MSHRPQRIACPWDPAGLWPSTRPGPGLHESRSECIGRCPSRLYRPHPDGATPRRHSTYMETGCGGRSATDPTWAVLIHEVLQSSRGRCAAHGSASSPGAPSTMVPPSGTAMPNPPASESLRCHGRTNTTGTLATRPPDGTSIKQRGSSAIRHHRWPRPGDNDRFGRLRRHGQPNRPVWNPDYGSWRRTLSADVLWITQHACLGAAAWGGGGS